MRGIGGGGGEVWWYKGLEDIVVRYYVYYIKNRIKRLPGACNKKLSIVVE